MEWRKCPNWPDYEVSENGDIRRTVARSGAKPALRKPYVAANGRLMIVMRSGGVARACYVHRLILEAFVGPAPSDAHQGAHNDGDPLHNHVSNLRWATKQENEADKVRHGTSNRGERFGRARLTNDQAEEIKRCLAAGFASRDLAMRFGVHPSTISSLKRGKSWAWLTPAVAQERAA